MKIIDFHAHIYPEKIADKATANTAEFYNIHTDLTGTSQSLLKRGKQAGISEFVLLPVATKPEQVRHVNDFILNEAKAHEAFYGFGTLHASMQNLMEEAEYIVNSGLRGLKLHPDTQGFNTDDERLFEVYDYLQDKIPVLVHCGDKRFDYSHPRRLKKVIDNFPRMRVIAAHLGGWSLFDEAYEILRATDCSLDISSCTMFLPAEKVRRFINGYGAERILFGTDFPLWDPVTEVEAFYRLGLSQSDMEKIAHINAEKILIG